MSDDDIARSDPGRSARAIEKRRKLILELIIRAGSAQVEGLASRFGVSRMTIHRDLDALVEQGMVRKQHGGVTLHESGSAESSFSYRSRLAERQKNDIARAAAALVQSGQSVILDESTTTLFIAPHLSGRTPLTVITNGVAMIESLREAHGVRLIGLGGTYNAHLNGFFGLICETTVASLRANILFMSTSAIDGYCTFHQDEEVLRTKRAFMASAARKVLIADSSKFGVTALNHMAELVAFDAVITDDGLPEAERMRLRDAGVPLTIADG